MKRNIIITILALLCVPFLGFSQDDAPLSKKEQRKNRSVYYTFSMGYSGTKFRDLATSPLIYKGLGLYYGFSYKRLDSKRETEVGSSFSSGTYKTHGIESPAVSTIQTIDVFYSQLYRINKLSNDKLNLKVGGLIDVSQNIRINPYFSNNSFGLDNVSTLFGSVKATRDLSKVVKNEMKRRSVSLRLDVSVMNNTYRNGYVYSGQSSIVNEPKLFDDYEFKAFSGFRMNLGIDYTMYFKNNNAIEVSYLWTGYKTGGDLDQFAMSSQVFKMAFLFNTK
ncbi:hypothetical protein [Flammeovirga kamogawensis]|uniref:Outer membrane beta-barrel protein n=1 Tax=Flammeovirga kamogawensis TaxID=373891 RepID=A0ABX8GUH9_9BACT|nr:hypothetical protein [Flammeovirga kamogawensis]MBB6459684.1 hypothetical protein [Flammeovirga kamogawensis]QWG07254.1 hypothetical protein KM029_18420 [Flammeovirga kamogawensis]TRX69074.1 hypothetical protein EO216_13410 [Flammeovirga kamogawensis]